MLILSGGLGAALRWVSPSQHPMVGEILRLRRVQHPFSRDRMPLMPGGVPAGLGSLSAKQSAMRCPILRSSAGRTLWMNAVQLLPAARQLRQWYLIFPFLQHLRIGHGHAVDAGIVLSVPRLGFRVTECPSVGPAYCSRINDSRH
jgi:hypothetical protein